MNKSLNKILITAAAFILIFALSPAPSALGQKTVRVTASGSYVSMDLTPEQTRVKALEEAKKNALLKAGVGEMISVSDFLYTFEDNEKFREIFQAFTSTETGGEVMVDEILDERRTFNSFGNMVIEVDISATVFIHKEKSDPALSFRVDGINEYYKNGQMLKFTVTPTADGYLKIFNITEDESSLLYPFRDGQYEYLNDDPEYMLKAARPTVFPILKVYEDGYTLDISKPAKDREFNLLVFVFTRKNIRFIDNAGSVEEIMRWIYSIPPDQRRVMQVGFVISD